MNSPYLPLLSRPGTCGAHALLGGGIKFSHDLFFTFYSCENSYLMSTYFFHIGAKYLFIFHICLRGVLKNDVFHIFSQIAGKIVT